MTMRGTDENQEFNVRKSLLFPVNSKNELFIQDRRGYKKPDWGFFGGSIEAGENPLDAMIRESKEELNLDLKEEDLTYLGTSATEWDGSSIIRHLYLYPTEQINFDVREGKGGRWLSFEEVRKRMDDQDRFDEVVALIQQYRAR